MHHYFIGTSKLLFSFHYRHYFLLLFFCFLLSFVPNFRGSALIKRLLTLFSVLIFNIRATLFSVCICDLPLSRATPYSYTYQLSRRLLQWLPAFDWFVCRAFYLLQEKIRHSGSIGSHYVHTCVRKQRKVIGLRWQRSGISGRK